MGQKLEIAFMPGMKVGLGYDMLTGSATVSAAVSGDAITAPAQAQGPVTTTSLKIVQDIETFRSTLDIAVDAGGSYMGFEGNAKFKFADECSVTQFCTYVVIAVRVFNAVQTFDNPALVPDANTLVANLSSGRFRTRFGDRFISGIRSGGEYYAVYRVQSFDSNERTSIASQIHASYDDPLASAHLDASINESKSKSSNKLDVSVMVYQAGAITKADLGLADMMQKAREFPMLVSGNQAVAYSVLLDEYNELKLPNDGFNPLDIQKQRETLAFNGQLLVRFKQVISDIDFIRSNIEFFANHDGSAPSDTELKNSRAACVQILDQLQSQASACSVDASKCSRLTQAPEDFTSKFPPAKPGAPVLFALPNFVGMTLDAAFAVANRFGIQLETIERLDDLRNGSTNQPPVPGSQLIVSGQSISSGTTIQPVPAGTPVMPGTEIFLS